MAVAPREGRVSRNRSSPRHSRDCFVAPREGRVSRNLFRFGFFYDLDVAPREGRVSRNVRATKGADVERSRAPRGACE